MSDPTIIPFEAGQKNLNWMGLVDAMKAGHALPRAEITDSFLYRGDDTLLNRAAWIDGLGLAVKTATIFPGNASLSLPQVNGGMCLYDNQSGLLQALLDFHLVTKWKTAGDSLLAALTLAPPKVETILIIGAGHVASTLYDAYSAGFGNVRFLLWNRTAEKAQELAHSRPNATAVSDLAAAVEQADIIACATMSREPVLRGEWLRPGQHIDLIGAFRPDMREADDTALTRARVFVDSYATTLDHIGELKIPLEHGVITRQDVIADYYDLPAFTRSPDDITLCKNGGGAHLDLMTAHYILSQWDGGKV